MRFDAPRGKRSGKSWPPMAGEEEAGCAPGLRSKTKPSGGKLGQAVCLPKHRDEHQALKSLFERPGGVLHRSCLDDEEARRVEAKSDEARPIRASPFARDVFCEAPQQEFPGRWRCRAVSDRGKGKTERGGGVAVGGRPDLVQSRLVELVEKLLPPERGKVGKGVEFQN
jgi:hypothetical protein